MSSHKEVRPREEVEPVVRSFEKFADRVTHGKMKVKVCGSIRRGRKEVGDVDLVTNVHLVGAIGVMLGWADEEGHVVDILSNLEKAEKAVQVLVDGVQWDMYLSSEEGWGAMVLSLTGSMKFNIIMRAKAKKDEMKLNQYGLWQGENLIAGRTEEQIFMALGIEYREPKERDLQAWQKL